MSMPWLLPSTHADGDGAPLCAGAGHRSAVGSSRRLNPSIPEDVEAAILKGMALHPEDRPQTVAEWLALLPAESALQEKQPATFEPAIRTQELRELEQLLAQQQPQDELEQLLANTPQKSWSKWWHPPPLPQQKGRRDPEP
jgi:hypothetical protein